MMPYWGPASRTWNRQPAPDGHQKRRPRLWRWIAAGQRWICWACFRNKTLKNRWAVLRKTAVRRWFSFNNAWHLCWSGRITYDLMTHLVFDKHSESLTSLQGSLPVWCQLFQHCDVSLFREFVHGRWRGGSLNRAIVLCRPEQLSCNQIHMEDFTCEWCGDGHCDSTLPSLYKSGNLANER